MFFGIQIIINLKIELHLWKSRYKIFRVMIFFINFISIYYNNSKIDYIFELLIYKLNFENCYINSIAWNKIL